MTLFYVLSLIMIIMRLYELIMTMPNVINFNYLDTVVPPTMKVNIALVQIEVIVELVIRVRDSVRKMKLEQQRVASESTNIQSANESHERADKWVFFLRIVTLVSIITTTSFCFIYFSLKSNSAKDQRQLQEKLERAQFLKQSSRVFGWIFLGLSILLAFSVALLICTLRRLTSEANFFPGSFNSEIKNLVVILVIFLISYFFFFVSDVFVLPKFQTTENIEKCVLRGYTYCVGFGQLIYYTWVNSLSDFLPVFCIFCFHHVNFRVRKVRDTASLLQRRRSRQLSSTDSERGVLRVLPEGDYDG